MYTTQHTFYCGVDLHARTMYLCVLEAEGKIRLHPNLPTRPDAFLEAIEPFQMLIAADLAMINTYDQTIHELELFLGASVRNDDGSSYHLLPTVPGIGNILALTMVYEIHIIERFPRVSDFLCYSRLVKGDRGSAGKKSKPLPFPPPSPAHDWTARPRSITSPADPAVEW